MPQFDWLCDVCGYVMSPTSGIYWVDISFINNYKEHQLWLVLLRYSVDVAKAFLWVVTYGIKAAGVRCWYPLIGLYVRICVDLSPSGVRCWYPLTRLYVRICDVCMWYFALINYMYVFSNDFQMWYICIKWFVICFGIIIFDIIEWACEKSKYSCFAWLYSIVYSI